MKWFLWLVLLVALLTGALYGVGRFLLPVDVEVTRFVTIERPRASVFAMINDLRIAREWSPFYARDPEADFQFSEDPPGEGQSMRWSSRVREIGDGRMTIERSVMNEDVRAKLEFNGRADLTSHMRVRRVEEGTSVAWTIAGRCPITNVACRYMNLVLPGTIRTQLDSGLARLKTLAEQLPAADFEGADIVEDYADSQNVIFVDVTIVRPELTPEQLIEVENCEIARRGSCMPIWPTFADRDAAERDGAEVLFRFMQASNPQFDGKDGLFRVFPAATSPDRYSFSVGYPYEGPAPLRLVGVRAGQTPGGAVLRAMFVGRRSQIPAMYGRLDAYLQAHRIARRPGAESWEVVRRVETPAPDSAYPNDPIEHTEIYFPIQSQSR